MSAIPRCVRITPVSPNRTILRVDPFEDRLVPSLTVQFDYSQDTSGLFSNPAAQASLQFAADTLTAQITSDLPAIVPNAAAGNTWSAVFPNPSTGATDEIPNLTVPQDTIVVYVGGRPLNGTEAGQGGPGGYQAGGSTAWVNSIVNRGPIGYGSWGGAISFDTNQHWYFGSDPNTIPAGEIDFYSVATHELGHVLGFGTSTAWSDLIQNGHFIGAATTALAGSSPAISADGAHFAMDTHSPGCNCPACVAARMAAADGQNGVSMQPILNTNQRVGFSELDYAALKDMGWQISDSAFSGSSITASPPPASPPAAVVPPVTPPTLPTVTPANVIPGLAPGAATTPTGSGTTDSTTAAPQTGSKITDNAAVTSTPTTTTTGITTNTSTGGLPAGTPASQVAIVSGSGDGSIQVCLVGTNGQLTPVGDPLYPFPGFTGTVRAVAADLTDDGTADIVAGVGPGGGSQIAVLDGRTFTPAAASFSAFEPSFNGGVFLAAGDIGNTGKDDLIVTPDDGGGARVRILGLNDGQLNSVVPDFFGINDPNFRGGARTAVADVNGDGMPDLIVAAGTGGGPRVSIIDGRTLLSGTHQNLVPDFFAFDPTLTNGVYVAAGQVAGGGTDLVFGAGPGGGPRMLVVSAQTLMADGSAVALANPAFDTFVGNASDRGGVRVAVKNGNVVAGSGSGPLVQVYTGNASGGFTLATATDPLAATTNDGIYVG
ncbi:matrixin family metalloprotease [Fimbriiglobus ruber]|uniref:Filamentous hemagglutinin-like protein n=1 Tax=Fimbriiglobus ruber TaxID=1908690 RepID=A0A225DPH3_9BACT|nr:matrixin family metalloprotease [Fimbriiglobus ruber]OWK43201.1 Filamentous hemagglutinin-like protein [Fimbriiglobus ruber]